MKNLILIAILFCSAAMNVNAQECTKWGSGQDSIKALQNYNLYRESFKVKDYNAARVYWKQIFLNNPGARISPFVDGVKMYKSFIKEAKEDKELKEKYVDTLFMVFDKRIECHGEEGKVLGRKAVYMYSYRSKTAEQVKACLDAFDRSFELTGDNAEPFVFTYYFKTAIKGIKKEVITKTRALEIYLHLAKLIEVNLAKEGLDDKKKAKYEKAKTGIETSLKKVIESCADAQGIFGPEYEKRPDDQSLWQNIFSIYGSLGDECIKDPIFLEVTEKLFNVDSTANKAFFLAKNTSDKAKADKFFQLSVEKETDMEKKAQYAMGYASFLYESKGNFSKARTVANEAASYKEGWGEPYYFIGNLYAASGPKCGSGTGFDSQVVTLVAIDMWNKAISIDPSIKDKASQKIAKYSAYLPSNDDVFMRGLSVGASYKVECWINRSTTIRIKK